MKTLIPLLGIALMVASCGNSFNKSSDIVITYKKYSSYSMFKEYGQSLSDTTLEAIYKDTSELMPITTKYFVKGNKVRCVTSNESGEEITIVDNDAREALWYSRYPYGGYVEATTGYNMGGFYIKDKMEEFKNLSKYNEFGYELHKKTETTETRNILGYNCKKVEYKSTSRIVSIFYTPELPSGFDYADAFQVYPFITELEGLPLMIVDSAIAGQAYTYKIIADKVEKQKIADSVFILTASVGMQAYTVKNYMDKFYGVPNTSDDPVSDSTHVPCDDKLRPTLAKLDGNWYNEMTTSDFNTLYLYVDIGAYAAHKLGDKQVAVRYFSVTPRDYKLGQKEQRGKWGIKGDKLTLYYSDGKTEVYDITLEFEKTSCKSTLNLTQNGKLVHKLIMASYLIQMEEGC